MDQEKIRKMFLVIEPHAALFRYLQVARRRFETLVLTSDPESCIKEEAQFNENFPGVYFSQIDSLIKTDVTSCKKMFEDLGELRTEIAGVVAGDDPFVPVAAELGRLLDFNCSMPDDAICQQLKSSMKRRLAERGVQTPEFFIVRELDHAITIWENFGRDCVVKMVDYLGSMNVYRIQTLLDLKKAWNTITQNLENIPTPFKLSPDVLLEKFISGKEFSIEGYVQDEKPVILNFTEKITETNFVVVGHYLPARVSKKEADALDNIAKQCATALGIKNSVFHMEVNLHNGIPYVIESASRPPGQHVVELIEKAYGIDLMEISVDLAVGHRVSTHRRPPLKHFSIFALYSLVSGIVKELKGWHQLQKRGGVMHASLDVKEGDYVRKLRNFNDKYGFVVLEDISAKEIRKNTKWMHDNVYLVIDE